MLVPPAEAIVHSGYVVALARNRADIQNARKRMRRKQLTDEEKAEIRQRRRKRDAARYERDRDKIVARVKRYYRKNRTAILARQNHPDRKERNAVRNLLYSAAKRAAQKGWDFNLEFSDIQIPERCPVLGIALASGSGARGVARDCNPSLDRFDNSKGYVKGNVRVISLRANKLKSDAALAELEALVAYLRGAS